MTTDALLAVTTVDSEELAYDLARKLVRESLAACVQVSSPVKSFYEWQGKVCEDVEYQMWIKLSRQSLNEFKDWLEAHHPYEVHELLVTAVEDGNPKYLEWLLEQSAKGAGQ